MANSTQIVPPLGIDVSFWGIDIHDNDIRPEEGDKVNIANGASYLPLRRGAQYYFRGSYGEKIYYDGIKLLTTNNLQGDIIYYFSSTNIENSWINYSMFGLGGYVSINGSVYSIEVKHPEDIINIDFGQFQLLLPHHLKINQKIEFLIEDGECIETLTFIGYESIQVPAGFFKDCLKITKEKKWITGEDDKDIVWLARDVGLVKWQKSTGRIDVLVSYSIP
jgi:hypothetical protein